MRAVPAVPVARRGHRYPLDTCPVRPIKGIAPRHGRIGAESKDRRDGSPAVPNQRSESIFEHEMLYEANN